MTEDKKKNDDNNAPESSPNIFHIVDGIVENLDRTKKYKAYKELQKKINEKFDFEGVNEE